MRTSVLAVARLLVLAAIVQLGSREAELAAAEKFSLQPQVVTDRAAEVTVTLEVGGELIVTGDDGEQKLPLRVDGQMRYHEQMTRWSPAEKELARAVRSYNQAEAKIQVAEQSTVRKLEAEKTWVLTEVRDGEAVLNGGEYPFTREEVDLVQVTGNTLVLDRLLPEGEIAEGESWRHSAEVWKALLCMDHVAVCEVQSVATEQAGDDVKMRVAGTVHGTVDGAPTEIDLRGAYLFNRKASRVTQCNLAVKEVRKNSEFTPGLDVVAKVRIHVSPGAPALEMPEKVESRAASSERPVSRLLAYAAPEDGFRFLYDRAWYVTAEERNQFAFRYLRDHTLAAHCNVAVLPPRSAGRHTTLEEFEHDVRQSLEGKLETVTAATAWETPRGYKCLGVIAKGTVDQVAIEWRNYLVAADDCPRLSLGVTLEQTQSEQFQDAERQMIDTLELMPAQAASTAAQPTAGTRTR